MDGHNTHNIEVSKDEALIIGPYMDNESAGEKLIDFLLAAFETKETLKANIQVVSNDSLLEYYFGQFSISTLAAMSIETSQITEGLMVLTLNTGDSVDIIINNN